MYASSPEAQPALQARTGAASHFPPAFAGEGSWRGPPDRGVPEELGDMDQDRIEQLDELFRIYLQTVLVLREGRDSGRLHSNRTRRIRLERL